MAKIEQAVENAEKAAQERSAVVAEAMTWMGTPHHHQARVKGAGVDCGQFLLAVFEDAGLIPHTEVQDYPHDWHVHNTEERYLTWVEKFAKRLPKGATPQAGDIALFKFCRCISHGAIVTEWPQVVHSYLRRGVILDDVEANLELAPRLVGFWSVWPRGEA